MLKEEDFTRSKHSFVKLRPFISKESKINLMKKDQSVS
jgi:hypothetical protein